MARSPSVVGYSLRCRARQARPWRPEPATAAQIHAPSSSAVAIPRLGGWWGALAAPFCMLALIGILIVAQALHVPEWTFHVLWGAIGTWAVGRSASKAKLKIQRDGVFSIQGARPRWYKAGEKVPVDAGEPVTLRTYADEKSALQAWQSSRRPDPA